MISGSQKLPTKDSVDLCLPFIRLKDLSERDLKLRREHIEARILDEERIRKDKELKRERKLAEKAKAREFLSESNFIWGRETIRLPTIACSKKSFPTTKPYLTLFDSSTYRFPLSNKCNRQKDPLIKFNTPATIVEVERDFHPILDHGIYRKQLENQIRCKHKFIEENRRYERSLDEQMIRDYPFGEERPKVYSDRFQRIKVPIEQGLLSEVSQEQWTTNKKLRITKKLNL